MKRRPTLSFQNVLALAVLLSTLASCGGLPEVRSPVGEPVLPDLVAEPPVDLRVRYENDDRVTVRFSSTLANIGEGDLILRASRSGADTHDWQVTQEVVYSDSGAELIPTDAEMHWGGDGHEHWHIKRVAAYTLYRLDAKGEVVEDDIALPDSKIGFCFYDHSPIGAPASEEGTYIVHACGQESETELRVGMSPGWADIYGFDLPGQSIDVTELTDGPYRLVAVADPDQMFLDSNLENNETWIDFELLTRDGDRFAGLTDVGPTVGDG